MAGPDITIPIQFEGEIWKPFPEAVGYEVSTLGRIRSYWKNRHGIRKTPHIIVGGFCNKGYRCVKIKYTDRYRTVTTYKMVLLTFVGPCPSGMEACHGDGNPKNDRLDNLRWDTPSNNQRDKKLHGTHREGEKINFAKLTAAAVEAIRNERIQYKLTMKQLAKRYNVKWQTVQDIINRRTWKHVGGGVCPQ